MKKIMLSALLTVSLCGAAFADEMPVCPADLQAELMGVSQVLHNPMGSGLTAVVYTARNAPWVYGGAGIAFSDPNMSDHDAIQLANQLIEEIGTPIEEVSYEDGKYEVDCDYSIHDPRYSYAGAFLSNYQYNAEKLVNKRG